MLPNIDIFKSGRGTYQVWEPPVADAHYILGADIAQGSTFGAAKEKGDHSCLCIMRRVPNGLIQVAEGVSKAEVYAFGAVCAAMGQWYNSAIINIERNWAHAAIAALRSMGYPEDRWYIPPLISSIYEAQNSQYFFHKNKTTQKALIDTLIDYGDPEAPRMVIRSKATLAELNSLQREGVTNSPNTNGKDRTIALAMAVYADSTSEKPVFEVAEKKQKVPDTPHGMDPQLWKERHGVKKSGSSDEMPDWGENRSLDMAGFPEWGDDFS